MITMKDIVREGHPALREKSKPVTMPPSEEDKELLNRMLTFLKNSQDEEIADKYELRSGVGLAAPRLGLNKQMIAIYFMDKNDKLYSYQLFNPKIIRPSVEKFYVSIGEGCRSVDLEVPG